MRLKRASAAEIAAADSLPWDAPFASMVRPVPFAVFRRTTSAAAVLYLAAVVVGLIQAANADHVAGTHATALVVLAACAAAAAALLALMPFTISPRTVRRISPGVTVLGLASGSLVSSVVVLAAGPSMSTWAAAYVEVPIFAFYLLKPRWAAVATSLVAAEYAAVLSVQDDVAAPALHWLVVIATVITTAVIIGGIAERSDRLSESEHAAKLALADVNRTLEDRVDIQVDEIERLGTLRRFLSPQVADVMLSTGSAALSQPHGQDIAVAFCDLRGFTSFTNQAPPEVVLGVLDEYYRAVGAMLQRYEATIGGYAGDGIMAYFGDPVPRDDAAVAAVRMAAALRVPMDRLVAGWTRRGHELSYGIGLAYGYATLGVVGFDGRYDYTPIGAVVNLAARLCGQAAPGQILLDFAMHAATAGHVASTHFADLEVKGYGAAIPAYALPVAP